MKPHLLRALVLACASIAFAFGAQGQGGQRRPRVEGQSPEAQGQAMRPARTTDPVFALERELPSLRTDLGLDPGQQALWGPFERSVRDAAELTRQSTRKFLAPRPVDAPPPAAPGLLAALAEDERMRADAIVAAAASMKTLYEVLSPVQRSLFDRRVLLSQSEPLGNQ
ncbi:MAG: Spy/CpxP family protein refolding chaperone [Betaproteobacteria bacterium]|nr:Spy/CpxP family protein refolding chaperone [Betaproteobacteria bacterium]